MQFPPCALLALFICTTVPAQVPEPDRFDEISRRAGAALQSNPREAAELYGQAVAIRPTWAEGWFYLGASQYELKQYPQAQEALLQATALAKANGAAWALLGLVRSDLGDYPRALANIVKAEELGLPDNPPFISKVRVCAASILIRSSEFSAAIEQLRPLAMTNDKSPSVIEAFGIAALTMPRTPSDLPPDKKALVVLAGRAIWSFYAQQWSEAETLFKDLGEKYPNEPGVHYLLGIALVDRDLDAARKEFTEETVISPANALAQVQIAILRLRTGEPQGALSHAEKAVKLAPDNLLCHLVLGRAWLALDKVPSAIAEFERALKLNPDYPHTHFYLAQAYRQAGRNAEAEREQAAFTKLKGAGSPTAGAGPPEK